MEFKAVYQVEAMEYSFGGSLPYTTNVEKIISAEDIDSARDLAQKSRFDAWKGLLQPKSVRLLRLEEIAEVA